MSFRLPGPSEGSFYEITFGGRLVTQEGSPSLTIMQSTSKPKDSKLPQHAVADQKLCALLAFLNM